MNNNSARRRPITAAQRGQIIQRVIVDGWSSARAAAVFGVRERLVAAWVADYRRYGMASLRRKTAGTFVAEIIRPKVALPVAIVCRGVFNRLRGWLVAGRRAPALPLHRSRDDGRGSGS
jgi:transposase-like protein